MKTVCFFNNKGGVGKTTLVCNVAAYIADHFAKRVLVVDADPQSNATQLMLDDETMASVYKPFRHRSARRDLPAVTLFDVLQPIAAGEPDINGKLVPIARSSSRFRVSLIPGHPQVATLEDKLSQAWLAFGGGDLGGARITNWNTQLRASVDKQFDICFFDVGPSLGALNRSVLVGADFFLTPMGCDIFSLMGVANISGWLSKWMSAYSDSISKCKQTWDVEEYPVRTDVPKISRFVGYTVQQYITKSKGGVRRPTVAYEKIMNQIPATVDNELGPFVADGLAPASLRLPDVPHMFSLVPLAQNANCPIHRMTASDGLVGAQYAQQQEYVHFIRRLSEAVIRNVAL